MIVKLIKDLQRGDYTYPAGTSLQVLSSYADKLRAEGYIEGGSDKGDTTEENTAPKRKRVTRKKVNKDGNI